MPHHGQFLAQWIQYGRLTCPLRFIQIFGIIGISEAVGQYFIKTSGGGKEAQIQASRLVIAKALLAISGSDTLKKAYITYDRNMVVPDSRRKEARKPGDSKARSRRQKSYR